MLTLFPFGDEKNPSFITTLWGVFMDVVGAQRCQKCVCDQRVAGSNLTGCGENWTEDSHVPLSKQYSCIRQLLLCLSLFKWRSEPPHNACYACSHFTIRAVMSCRFHVSLLSVSRWDLWHSTLLWHMTVIGHVRIDSVKLSANPTSIILLPDKKLTNTKSNLRWNHTGAGELSRLKVLELVVTC